MQAEVVRRPAALPWIGRRTLTVIVALTLAVAFAVYVGRHDFNLGAFWIIGIAFGVILQRSRLCFAGAFRDLVLLGDGRLMRAILIGLAVATVGFSLLEARFVPDPSFGTLPQGAYVQTVGWTTVAGGLAFGIGMVLAGGCMTGTLWRMGEGYLNSWLAMGGILVGLWAAASTWDWWYNNDISHRKAIWLPAEIGMAGAIVAVLAALALLYVVVLWWEMRSPRLPAAPTAPEPPAFTVRAYLASGLRKIFQGRAWPYLVGAIALGILNVFAYALKSPLGVTGELGIWSDRIASNLFNAGQLPLAGADKLAGCTVAPGAWWVSNGTGLVLGIPMGAFLASVVANEFRLRWSHQVSRYPQVLGGGLLMGYGALIGAGCTIGAFFSSIPSLALAGWVFGFSLLGGAFIGTQIIRRLP
jgi:uncharacterized membrane protein YedE/YeeE